MRSPIFPAILLSVIIASVLANPVPQESGETDGQGHHFADDEFDVDHAINNAMIDDAAGEANSDSSGPLEVGPEIVRRRVRRQSDSDSGAAGGLGNMFQNFGGRLNTLRDNWRDTFRPIQQSLNPRPMLESAGNWLQTSASNMATRGREAFQGGRDFVSRGSTRLREGLSDTWDGLRDGWEDFWDL